MVIFRSVGPAGASYEVMASHLEEKHRVRKCVCVCGKPKRGHSKICCESAGHQLVSKLREDDKLLEPWKGPQLGCGI